MSSVVKSYRAALDSVWADLKQLSVLDVERNEKQRRIGLTIVWFVASLLLALFAGFGKNPGKTGFAQPIG
jgi:hypothetical protein